MGGGAPGLFYNWPTPSFFFCELKTLREKSMGTFSRHPEKEQEGTATSFKDTDSDLLDLPPPPTALSIPKTTKFRFTENLAECL